MRIIVDLDACTGHGRCAALAPEVYSLNEEGLNGTHETVVPPGLEDQARRGASNCPERAITLVDD